MVFVRRFHAAISPGTTPEQMERLRSIIGSMSANPTAGEPGLFQSHCTPMEYSANTVTFQTLLSLIS